MVFYSNISVSFGHRAEQMVKYIQIHKNRVKINGMLKTVLLKQSQLIVFLWKIKLKKKKVLFLSEIILLFHYDYSLIFSPTLSFLVNKHYFFVNHQNVLGKYHPPKHSGISLSKSIASDIFQTVLWVMYLWRIYMEQRIKLSTKEKS